MSVPPLSDGTVGFDPENIVVTEGVDNFAIVEVRFISPVLISDGVFVNLMVFTMDGSAQGLFFEILGHLLISLPPIVFQLTWTTVKST